MRIGVMQGRMIPKVAGQFFQCFPREEWPHEFPLAAEAGLQSIEWIYDAQGEALNPLGTAEGREEMRAACASSGVIVNSVCADYFMDRPLTRANGAEFAALQTKLVWLMEQCGHAGITRMVLPFVDASRIDSDAHEDLVVGLLADVLPEAAKQGVEIHLETSLEPKRFAALLEKLSHPFLRANYDSGNSSSLGYHPDDEFDAYGGRIGSVHMKDRVLGGGTVPLGSGDADFAALFSNLARHEYRGDFILQVARETEGEELELARRNLAFTRDWITRAGLRGEAA
jgi:hexulose-6-phosphate isomerase